LRYLAIVASSIAVTSLWAELCVFVRNYWTPEAQLVRKRWGVRVWLTYLDLWEHQEDLSWIKDEIHLPLIGSTRTIQLSFWDKCDTNIFLERSGAVAHGALWNGGHDGPYSLPAVLDIKIKEFVPQPGREHRHNLRVLVNGTTPELAQNSYYAIPSDSLPTLESLETWALELTRFRRRAIFGDNLQGSFMSLARKYAECEKLLPLVSGPYCTILFSREDSS